MSSRISTGRVVLAGIYLILAGIAAWQTIQHTNTSTDYFDQACSKESLENNGAQVVDHFVSHHEVIGPFIVSYAHKNLHLPSIGDATEALKSMEPLKQASTQEAGLAARWSWSLLGLSSLYMAIAAMGLPSKRTRQVLFALTHISAVLFVVGISASVMMIFTTIHDFFGVSPIIQHQVRSIFSVIASLFTTGHWIFGCFITLFSILTPCLKITMTSIATAGVSRSFTDKISKFLEIIDKWSMTDVFVAAVILACFTIKTGEATQVLPCLGLYYFAGYALLSMITTSLLSHLNLSSKSR